MRRNNETTATVFERAVERRIQLSEDMIDGHIRQRTARQLDGLVRTVCIVVIVVGVSSALIVLARSLGVVYGG